MISFFTSFCGFAGAKLDIKEGESLNRSSIPDADWGVFSTAFGGTVFSAVDTSAAAETVIIVIKLQPKFYTTHLIEASWNLPKQKCVTTLSTVIS